MFTKQASILGRRPSILPENGNSPVLGSAAALPAMAAASSAPINPLHQLSDSHRSPSIGSQTETVAEPAPAHGSRLIVGPDVKLRGAEILDCDTLVVEGRVEATMDSRVIQIAEQGAFAGKVGIDIAEIRGEFDGELTAREQLIIYASGRVRGTIRYGKLLVEAGGVISGDVQSIDEAAKPRATDERNTAPVSLIATRQAEIARDAALAVTDKEVIANAKRVLGTVVG